MTIQIPPQIGTPFQQAMRLYHIITPMFEEYVGISMARWRVLLNLYQSGQLSQSELQQRLQVDPAAITRQVKQLEEDGVIIRWPSPEDNRVTLVALTETGHAQTKTLYSRRDAFEQAVMQGISDVELVVFERCLAQIRDNAHKITANNVRSTITKTPIGDPKS